MCGEAANARDHFIPRAFVKTMEEIAHIPRARIIVPCCTECNSTAGAKVFFTLKEKRIYIGEQYKKKYKKLLNAPTWTETEINALSYTLQSHIRQAEIHKRVIKRRISKLLAGVKEF